MVSAIHTGTWINEAICKKASPVTYQYNLHSTIYRLEPVKRTCYFGCLITSYLHWNVHINNIHVHVCGKATQILQFLQPNISTSSTSVKENSYKSLVKQLPFWLRIYHQNGGNCKANVFLSKTTFYYFFTLQIWDLQDNGEWKCTASWKVLKIHNE